MDFYSIFFHVIGDFFGFLLIDLFVTYNTKNHSRQRILRPFFLFAILLYDLLQLYSLSYILEILTCAQILICCDKKLINRLIVLVKYYAYSYISAIVFLFARMILFEDFSLLYNNDLYTSYNTIACIIISYIVACMYFNTKKVKLLSSAKPYIFLYYFISIATIVSLSIAPILIEPSVLNSEQLLPAFFILIAFIITFSLTTYSKVAITLEENAINKIHLEKVAMEAEYNTQIDDKLQQLHTLRHDMKNHLLLIDSFANENQIEKIQSYIRQISTELQQTQAITTSSSTISSLLNAKKLICDENSLSFDMKLDFGEIYLDDFTIITVLSNMLDNAITAASKVENGYIHLTMEQMKSYLSIRCENNHCEIIKKKEGRFISSKSSCDFKSNSMHGLGIMSLTNTVNKHGGTVDIQYDDNTFSVNILIPNYT